MIGLPSDLLWKWWYPILTRLTRDARVAFLNYGYADDDKAAEPLLEERDEPDRPCIHLYDRVASAIDLHGLRVLEVSCGHGGGASYVARYLRPASVLGIDRNPRAVELCNALHRVAGLTFDRGDALALDFADGAFDVVLNVEASHCYPDVPRFLSGVQRVLRPGGHLLFADFRNAGTGAATLRAQIDASGMDVVRCEDISRNVVRGMELDSDRSLRLVRDLVPRPLQRAAMRFAGVKGSRIYEALRTGQDVYLRYVLRKPTASAVPEGPAR